MLERRRYVRPPAGKDLGGVTKLSVVVAVGMFFLACAIALNPEQPLIHGLAGDLLYAKGNMATVASVAMLVLGLFFAWLVLKCHDVGQEFLAGLALQPATFFIALGGWRCLMLVLAWTDKVNHATYG